MSTRKPDSEKSTPEVRTKAELVARIKELEAQVAELSKPQWYNDWEDAEYSYGDISDAADNIGGDEVMRLTGSRQVCEVWVTHRALTLDSEGDADDFEVAVFTNSTDAEKCWPESLAALRALVRTSSDEAVSS